MNKIKWWPMWCSKMWFEGWSCGSWDFEKHFIYGLCYIGHVPHIRFTWARIKYGNLDMHAVNWANPPRGLFYLFPNFKMFYLFNRKLKIRSVFTVSLVASRSSKVDPMLICFDKKNADLSCQIIVTWSPGIVMLITRLKSNGCQVF